MNRVLPLTFLHGPEAGYFNKANQRNSFFIQFCKKMPQKYVNT